MSVVHHHGKSKTRLDKQEGRANLKGHRPRSNSCFRPRGNTTDLQIYGTQLFAKT